MKLLSGQYHRTSQHLGFVSFITVQSYDVHKSSSTLWPHGCIRLFAHYTTSLSSLCRRIWRYCTSNMVVRYILSSVYLILSQFSQLSFMTYIGLCVFSLHLSFYDNIENMSSQSYYHQIGSMTHLPLFMVRSWNNGMSCMSFYILIDWGNGLVPSKRNINGG